MTPAISHYVVSGILHGVLALMLLWPWTDSPLLCDGPVCETVSGGEPDRIPIRKISLQPDETLNPLQNASEEFRTSSVPRAYAGQQRSGELTEVSPKESASRSETATEKRLQRSEASPSVSQRRQFAAAQIPDQTDDIVRELASPDFGVATVPVQPWNQSPLALTATGDGATVPSYGVTNLSPAMADHLRARGEALLLVATAIEEQSDSSSDTIRFRVEGPVLQPSEAAPVTSDQLRAFARRPLILTGPPGNAATQIVLKRNPLKKESLRTFLHFSHRIDELIRSQQAAVAARIGVPLNAIRRTDGTLRQGAQGTISGYQISRAWLHDGKSVSIRN